MENISEKIQKYMPFTYGCVRSLAACTLAWICKLFLFLQNRHYSRTWKPSTPVIQMHVAPLKPSLITSSKQNKKRKFISYSLIFDGLLRHLVVAQMTSVCNLWYFLHGSACWTRLLAGRVLFFTGSSLRASLSPKTRRKCSLASSLPLGYFQSPGSPGGIRAGDDSPTSTSPIPHRPDLAIKLLQLEQFWDRFLKDQRDRSVTMTKNPKHLGFFFWETFGI